MDFSVLPVTRMGKKRLRKMLNLALTSDHTCPTVFSDTDLNSPEGFEQECGPPLSDSEDGLCLNVQRYDGFTTALPSIMIQSQKRRFGGHTLCWLTLLSDLDISARILSQMDCKKLCIFHQICTAVALPLHPTCSRYLSNRTYRSPHYCVQYSRTARTTYLQPSQDLFRHRRRRYGPRSRPSLRPPPLPPHSSTVPHGGRLGGQLGGQFGRRRRGG
jgi:hypothetical protein